MQFLRKTPGILHLMLSKPEAGETAMGIVNTVVGVTMLAGSLLVDEVFEPLVAPQTGILTSLFGSGKGSGAAMLFAVIGIAGVIVCLLFRRDRAIFSLEDDGSGQKKSGFPPENVVE